MNELALSGNTIVSAAGENRVALYVGLSQELAVFSRKQLNFLDAFFETNNFSFACKVSNAKESVANRWFHDRRFLSYVKQILHERAKRQGKTFDMWINRFWDSFDGKLDLSKNQVKSGEIIGKAMQWLTERRVHEFDTNGSVQFAFIQQGEASSSKTETTYQPRESQSEQSKAYTPDGRTEIWKDKTDALLVTEALRDSKFESMVCGTDKSTG